MPQIDFHSAQQYALGRLTRELPAALVYHSLAHTCDVVLPEAEQLAAQVGLDEETVLLLRTAAYFHDIGFVQQRAGHEAIGAQIAATELPRFGYTPAHIQIICDSILATRMPQTPHALPEQLLADADLSVFGRTDFVGWNTRLRAELAAYGTIFTDQQWYSSQLQFIESQRYWTQVARQRYSAQKQHNCDLMRRLLQQAQHHNPELYDQATEDTEH